MLRFRMCAEYTYSMHTLKKFPLPTSVKERGLFSMEIALDKRLPFLSFAGDGCGKFSATMLWDSLTVGEPSSVNAGQVDSRSDAFSPPSLHRL